MSQPGEVATRESPLLRAWRRLPIAVRAVLAGLFVFTVLQTGATALLLVSLQTSPALPWGAPLAVAFLALALLWFGGRGWPRSTAAARRAALRARRLAPAGWKWALIASGCLVVFIIAAAIVSYRLIEVPEDATDLSSLPWWSTAAALVTISITAGSPRRRGFAATCRRRSRRATAPWWRSA